MKKAIESIIRKEIDKKIKMEHTNAGWPPFCMGIMYEPERPKVITEEKEEK